MINAIVVLLGAQLFGEVCARLGNIPVPGPVIGALVLAAVLLVRRKIEGELAGVAHTILSHLSLLFVPAAVGVIEYRGLFATYGLPLVATLVVSTLLAMAVAALTFRWVKARTDA